LDRDLLEPISVVVMIIALLLTKVSERRIIMHEESKEIKKEEG